MIIHKCDRCKRETKHPHKIFYEDERTGATSKSAELCDRCYSKLIDWLNEEDDAAPECEHHWQTVTDKTERNGG